MIRLFKLNSRNVCCRLSRSEQDLAKTRAELTHAHRTIDEQRQVIHTYENSRHNAAPRARVVPDSTKPHFNYRWTRFIPFTGDDNLVLGLHCQSHSTQSPTYLLTFMMRMSAMKIVCWTNVASISYDLEFNYKLKLHDVWCTLGELNMKQNSPIWIDFVCW